MCPPCVSAVNFIGLAYATGHPGARRNAAFVIAGHGPRASQANRAVVPKPTLEANRCNLRLLTPKTPQKALYLGFAKRRQPLQVVCFGWSRFQGPEARLAAVGETNLRSDPLHGHSLC